MNTNKEMKELNPEMMEWISGGFRRYNPIFPGFPVNPLIVPEKTKDEPKDAERPAAGKASPGTRDRPVTKISGFHEARRFFMDITMAAL